MDTQTAAAGAPSRYGDLTVAPLSDALGAEVKGVNLAEIDDATYQAIRNAFVDNLVLLFRDRNDCSNAI